MRKLCAVAFAVVLLLTASLAQADSVSFSINVGGPPVVIEQPPAFLYPPELGYGVAVGVPYDLFYVGGIYYVFRGGGWYRTYDYGGRWEKVRHRGLPPELRRHKLARIHEYRDREYRVYSKDRDHYRGRYFRPDRPGRGEHHDGRGPGPGRGRDEHRGDRHDDRRDHGGRDGR